MDAEYPLLLFERPHDLDQNKSWVKWGSAVLAGLLILTWIID